MRKNNTYIFIALLILIIILIGRNLFEGSNSEYYTKYNRVISEPDTIKIIGDDL